MWRSASAPAFVCWGALLLLLIGHAQADTQQQQQCFTPPLDFSSTGNGLVINSAIPFALKGVSWFGFETSLFVTHGLWAVDYRSLLDVLKQNQFNALRIPLSLDGITQDPAKATQGVNFYCSDNGPYCVNHTQNGDLQNKTSLQILDAIVTAAADRGIVILLDLHSFEPDAFSQNGLWYDSTHTEQQVIAGWIKIASRYQNQWNVIALDIKNEPFQATWATGDSTTDWDSAVARIGNAIHSAVSDRFLIFAEGVAKSPSCPQACFYGGNLRGAQNNPIKTLDKMSRLVYSPHCYGPDVAYQEYFNDPSFPKNMPAIWTDHWGFVQNKTGSAVIIGEWGGHPTGNDLVWLNAFVGYLGANNLRSTFFWCLNPDSGDTGGIMDNSWTTADPQRLAILATLQPNPTKFTVSGGKVCVAN